MGKNTFERLFEENMKKLKKDRRFLNKVERKIEEKIISRNISNKKKKPINL